MKPQEQTVVFVATKHHVEYLREVGVGVRVGVCFKVRSGHPYSYSVWSMQFGNAEDGVSEKTSQVLLLLRPPQR